MPTIARRKAGEVRKLKFIGKPAGEFESSFPGASRWPQLEV